MNKERVSFYCGMFVAHAVYAEHLNIDISFNA